MTERRPYEPLPPIPPMSSETGNRVVSALGLALPFIGILTMAVERWTQMTMSRALGLPVFVSTPLGIGALAFVVLGWRVKPVYAARQAAAASVFWIFWIIWSFS